MNDIGYLAPDGTLYECEPWEHLDLAKELATKLAGHTSWNGVLAEDYLLDHGYVAVRARDDRCAKAMADRPLRRVYVSKTTRSR